MTNGREMHSNLVSTTGVQLQAQQRHGVRLVDARHDLVAGSSGSTVGAPRQTRRHPNGAYDRPVDDAPLFGDVTLHHPVVRAFHESLGQLNTQVRKAQRCFGDDQHTRSALVEPVHDARSHWITQTLAAQFAHLRIEGQQAGGERAVTVSGPGMYNLTRCFVDDSEVLVVEYDVHGDVRVRLDLGALRRG